MRAPQGLQYSDGTLIDSQGNQLFLAGLQVIEEIHEDDYGRVERMIELELYSSQNFGKGSSHSPLKVRLPLIRGFHA